MSQSRRNLTNIANGAGNDIAPSGPLHRSRGVEGLVTGAGEPTAIGRPSADLPVSAHGDPAPVPPPRAKAGSPRSKVYSYRITADLARRVKIYAAMHDL